MTVDDLKRYTVKVHDGSGCLFQPMNKDKYTYILTAKHIFFHSPDINGRPSPIVEKFQHNQNVDISQNLLINDVWTEAKIDFIYKKDENVFFHDDADAAILVLPFLEGFDKINKIDENGVNFLLSGFPGKWNVEDPGVRQSNLNIERIRSNSGNYFNYAEINKSFSKEHIEGMSGGPIIRITEPTLELCGIQSRMANAIAPLGQIGYIPMKYFDEIVSKYSLKELLPSYLIGYSNLLENTFNFQVGLSNEKGKLLKENLIFIKNSIHSELVIPYNVRKSCLEKYNSLILCDLNNPKYYCVWLELLIIFYLIDDKVINDDESLKDKMSKFKLLFKNSDKDFWIENLSILHELDYSELDDDAKIIVSSNIGAIDGEHILDLSKIPNDVYNSHFKRREFDAKKIVQDISVASDFPLDKYKFMNISAFKEGIYNLLAKDFEKLTNFQEIKNKIKEAYENQYNG